MSLLYRLGLATDGLRGGRGNAEPTGFTKLPDRNVIMTGLTDGNWITKQEFIADLSSIGNGTGSVNVDTYHDPLSNIKASIGLSLTLHSLDNVIGGVATIVFDNKFIKAWTSDPGSITMTVVAMDMNSALYVFDYTIDVT